VFRFYLLLQGNKRPLWVAACKGHLGVVTVLLDYGASVNAKDHAFVSHCSPLTRVQAGVCSCARVRLFDFYNLAAYSVIINVVNYFLARCPTRSYVRTLTAEFDATMYGLPQWAPGCRQRPHRGGRRH
jgi:hypothetical protein